MKKLLVIIVLFISQITLAQSNFIIANEINSINIEADQFLGIDEYDFQYFVKNNVLFKQNDTYKFEYQNISLSKISRVDLQNPLRILVFYESFNTVIALDRQLNEVSKTNFTEINPDISSTAIGLASQNNYWVFNQLNQQLYLYNYSKNSFQPIGVIFEKVIKKYFSTYNYFFWLDIDNCVYRLDTFGKKTFLCKTPSFDKISFSDENYFVFQQGDKLFLFDIEKNTAFEIKNVQNSLTSFYYKNQILSIFTPQGLTNYKINLP